MVLGISKIALCLRDLHVFMYVTVIGKFERFQYFNFETNFLENKNLFQKTAVPFLQLKILRLKMQHFHTRLPCHSEANVKRNKMRKQNGPITKSLVSPVTTLFFKKFCFSLRNIL